MASVAQLSTEFSITYDGLVVQFGGFDDSMPNYISETFKRMMGMKTAALEEVFNQQKVEVRALLLAQLLYSTNLENFFRIT